MVSALITRASTYNPCPVITYNCVSILYKHFQYSERSISYLSFKPRGHFGRIKSDRLTECNSDDAYSPRPVQGSQPFFFVHLFGHISECRSPFPRSLTQKMHFL